MFFSYVNRFWHKSKQKYPYLQEKTLFTRIKDEKMESKVLFHDAEDKILRAKRTKV